MGRGTRPKTGKRNIQLSIHFTLIYDIIYCLQYSNYFLGNFIAYISTLNTPQIALFSI